nr:hypothetical protein CFP56_38789 [Quercus suber]
MSWRKSVNVTSTSWVDGSAVHALQQDIVAARGLSQPACSVLHVSAVCTDSDRRFELVMISPARRYSISVEYCVCLEFEPLMPGSPSVRNLASNATHLGTLGTNRTPTSLLALSVASSRARVSVLTRSTRSTLAPQVSPMDASSQLALGMCCLWTLPSARARARISWCSSASRSLRERELRMSSKSGAHVRNFVENAVVDHRERETNEQTEVIAWKQGNAPGEFEKQNVLGAEVFPRGEV